MIFNMKVRVYHLNLILNVQFKLQDNWSQNPLKMECFHYIGLMALDSTLWSAPLVFIVTVKQMCKYSIQSTYSLNLN